MKLQRQHRHNEKRDVTIVGGDIVSICCVLALAEAGGAVLLIEQDVPGRTTNYKPFGDGYGPQNCHQFDERGLARHSGMVNGLMRAPKTVEYSRVGRSQVYGGRPV